MKTLILTLCMLFVAAVSFGEKITVTVSIPPQKYIVDKITGGNVDVNVMAPKGSDPHTFSPKAAQIKQLSNSKLYLAIGFPFESSMIPQIAKSHKGLVIVKTQDGLDMLDEDEAYIPASQFGDNKTVHAEGHDHLDPHVWTSPRTMMKISENTLNALVKIDPANRIAYENAYKLLLTDLETADNKFKELFTNHPSLKKFLVYHPAWGYFARDYGLEQYAVEVDGKQPKAKDLEAIIKKVKTGNIKVFLVQTTQSVDAANTVARELGIKTSPIDLLSEDWMGMTAEMYGAFAGALQ